MANQKGLGKGLASLLGDLDEDAAPGEQGNYKLLPLYKIEPNPDQPRKNFDGEELQALADSISVHGLLQPITVRETDSGYYQIVAGERRWRAARLAGLDQVPALLVEADDRKSKEIALIENLQRQDLNPVEEAMGYQTLIREHGLTQDEVAKQVGKSRPVVTNSRRLLSLCPEALEMLKNGAITAGHARALLTLPEKKQREAAQKVSALDLSVRQTEQLCKTLNQTPKPKKDPPLRVDYVAECEKKLSKHLGRGVKIVTGKRKGRFEIEFYGPEDLQTLLDNLLTLEQEGKNTNA